MRDARVTRAVEQLLDGRMVLLSPGNSADGLAYLVQCARFVTPDAINFMATHARGLVSLALAPEDVARLALPFQRQRGGGADEEQALVSIEARHGVSTGISASDRARTIQVAISREAADDDIVTPGHVFPLATHPGGTLARPMPAEGAIDLCTIAGLTPAAVICAVLDEDGQPADAQALARLGERFALPTVTIADIIAHRRQFDRQLDLVAESTIDTETAGEFRALVFRSRLDRREVLALVKGTLPSGEPVLVRIHEALPLYDLIGIRGRRAGLLQQCMKEVAANGSGVLVLIDNAREGLLSRALPAGAHAPAMSFQDYGLGAQVLSELGVERVELLTTQEQQMAGLAGFSLAVDGIRALASEASA